MGQVTERDWFCVSPNLGVTRAEILAVTGFKSCTQQEKKARPLPIGPSSSLSVFSPAKLLRFPIFTLTFICGDSWPHCTLPSQFHYAEHEAGSPLSYSNSHSKIYSSKQPHINAKLWKHLHSSSSYLRLCLFPSPLPDDDSSESGSANGLPALTSPEVLAVGRNVPDGGASYGEVAENGVSAPLDFSTTSSSSSSEDQQPVNLSDRLLPVGSSPPNSYPADPNRKYPIKTEYTNKVTAETWCALITINSRVSV